MIDRSVDWYTDQLIDRLIDSLIDRLIDKILDGTDFKFLKLQIIEIQFIQSI